MSISIHDAAAVDVDIDGQHLSVQLQGGRRLIVPLEWFPRLAGPRSEQLQSWRIIGAGEGIHWPDLDEDISVAGLLAGN